ncbi:MAG: hypothetical protein N4A33_12360 [Bacteriovoracaceae bacterium]|jgi:hypothetical protein|nr:hypothetical protein [Bacteriovoracaceae bacterium]
MGLIVIGLAALFTYYNDFAKKNEFQNYALFTYVPYLEYEFKNEIKSGGNTKLSPTRSTINGIAVKRKGFTYGIGYLQEDEKKDKISSDKKTTFFDLQLFTDMDKFLVSAYYQNYQGFFVNENETINLNQRHDISTVSYGINIKYFSKKGYDLGKTLLSDKKERVSGYSAFHSVYINSTTFKNNSTLFDGVDYEPINGLKQINIANAGYEYGYTGTIRFWKMHLTGVLSLGYNLHNIHLEKQNHANEVNGSFSNTIELDIGLYNNRNISIGVFAKNDNMEFKHETVKIVQTRRSAMAYFRYFF